MSSDWARFAKLAGIDLRRLPVSYLVLDKRPLPPLPAGAMRVIGRPRLYKAHASVLGCDDGGVCERRLMKRALPEVFRAIRKDKMGTLATCRCEGDVIVEMKTP